MPILRVGTAGPPDVLEVVAACRGPLTELLDALKTEHSVGGVVFRFEHGERNGCSTWARQRFPCSHKWIRANRASCFR